MAFRTIASPIVMGDGRSRLSSLHFLHHFTTGGTLLQMYFDPRFQIVWKIASHHCRHILVDFMTGDAAEVFLARRRPEAGTPEPKADSTD